MHHARGGRAAGGQGGRRDSGEPEIARQGNAIGGRLPYKLAHTGILQPLSTLRGFRALDLPARRWHLPVRSGAEDIVISDYKESRIRCLFHDMLGLC